MRRWLTVTGLAAAVVPSATLVHLVAEASALGRGALAPSFVLRHVYLAVLVAVSLAVFARTVGLGRPRAELRRRLALVAAMLRGPGGPLTCAALGAAHLAFFALTQLGEGIPLLTGDLALGLALGLLGSLLAALALATFGRGLVAAAARRLCWQRPHPTAPLAAALVPAAPARSAAVAFSLFVPNRPPPFPSLT
jgi:hypothetical protein